MRRVPFVSLALIVLVAACGENPSDAMGPDAGPAADAGPSYEDADWLFESGRLLEVEIEMPESSWDELRFETRNILELFGTTCGVEPAPKAFNYRTGTVTVDGITTTNVGVRKKGFLGSLDEERPSIKVKFNEYVEGQTLTGSSRMTLNNSVQDPSLMNQCLGYAVWNRAGVPAPRCNFARVTINGRSLGVYVHVESVKKPFLGRHFDDNDGNLYEGTLSDFRAGWMGTFERKTNKSDPPGDEDRSDLDAVVSALALGDAAMLTELDGIVDLERFYTFWAVEAMTSHWDGYAGNNNNYFVYGDPTSGKLVFMPWGIDQLFSDQLGSPTPALTRSALPRRLFLHGPSRDRYLARYTEILDNVWDDAEMLAEVARLETLLASSVLPARRQEWNDAMAALRATLSGRETELRAELAQVTTADADAVSDPLCFDEVGDADSQLSVTYAQGASTATTLSLTVNGTQRPVTDVTAYVGPDDNRADTTNLIFTATDGAGKSMVFFLSMPDADVGPGTIDVGRGLIESVLLFTPPGANDADEIYFLSGTLTLTSAAATPGSAWAGSLDLDVWDPPFF